MNEMKSCTVQISILIYKTKYHNVRKKTSKRENSQGKMRNKNIKQKFCLYFYPENPDLISRCKQIILALESGRLLCMQCK